MGFFDFLKSNKQKTKITFTETVNGKTIPISATKGEKVSKPKDLEHLTKEGELPFGWYSKHNHIFQPYEDKIVQTAVDLKPMKEAERIAQLEKLISLYYEYKQFCYKNGECYIKHFSNRWEHCHNSRCKDFEYIAPYVEELETIKSTEK